MTMVRKVSVGHPPDLQNVCQLCVTAWGGTIAYGVTHARRVLHFGVGLTWVSDCLPSQRVCRISYLLLYGAATPCPR
jgi:hypothetical protein